MKQAIQSGPTPPHEHVSPAKTLLRFWPLPAALALTLFPFGWLGEVWHPLGQLIDRMFPSAREHALGHGSLFFLLGLLALAAFPALRARPWRYAGLLFLAGIGQESFQFLYKQRLLVFDDVRDLATDLVGLLAAFAVVWAWRWVQRRRQV